MRKTHKSQLCKRLSALGIRQPLVHSIIDDVEKWVNNSGEEWTISRLKGLKVGFFQHLAGNPGKFPDWVSKKSDGLPKGAIGTVLRMAIDPTLGNPKRVQRAISALMVYSDFVANDITSNQWLKFQSSVEKDATGSDFPGLMLDIILQGDDNRPPFSSKIEKLDLHYNFMDWGASSTREPLMSGLIDGSGKTENEDMTQLWEGLRHPLAHKFLKPSFEDFDPFGKPGVKGETKLDIVTMAYLTGHRPDLMTVSEHSHLPVGKIGFIQEAGYKLRAVANPHRIFQYLLNPLKEDILNKLKSFTPDCTHNQNEGAKWAQRQLSEGTSVSSVDLSDATNNFPLSLQISMLNAMYPKDKEIVSLFEDVSRSSWIVKDPETKKVREIVWSVGQPLGLGPSFPSFAAAHHMLMWAAISDIKNDDPWRGMYQFMRSFSNGEAFYNPDYVHEYRIVGDDIVMKTKYEESYKTILTNLGMPVSSDKTITSSQLAEFASQVITPEQVYVQNKWKTFSDNSFLQFAKNIGPTSVGLMRPRQIKATKLLAQLPEWEGGLGWNPHGIPAHIRSTLYSKFINRNIDESQPYLQKEALALEKAKGAFGDSFSYEAIAPIVSETIDYIATLPVDRQALSVSDVDKKLKIVSRSYNPTDLPTNENDKPAVFKRRTGDPRPKSVLEHFEKSNVSDILKEALCLVTEYKDFVDLEPEFPSYITGRAEERIKNLRPVTPEFVKEAMNQFIADKTNGRSPEYVSDNISGPDEDNSDHHRISR